MYSPSAGYIWLAVPPLLKCSALILWFVGVYMLYSACLIIFRLRSAASRAQDHDTGLAHSLAALRTQSTNMRQLLGATFYVFAFIFFLTLPWATITLGNGASPFILILQNFIIFFDFAAYYVFSVFIALHFLQWFVSNRINSYAMRLNVHN